MEYLNEFLPTYENGTRCGGVREEREGVGRFHSVAPIADTGIPLMEEVHGVLDDGQSIWIFFYFFFIP